MKKLIQFIFVFFGIVVLLPYEVNAGACTVHANTSFVIQRNGSGCHSGNCTYVLRSNGQSYGMRRYDVAGYQTYCLDPGAKAPQNGFVYQCRREITPESNAEGPLWQAFDVAATWAYQYMVENGLMAPTVDNRVIGELVFRWIELAAYGLNSPQTTSDGTLALFRKGPAAFSQRDGRVAIATSIYASAVAVGNRIREGATYDQLVQEGLIWGDSWDFKVVDQAFNGNVEAIKLEVSPSGDSPANIHWDLFSVECTSGVVCAIVDRQSSGNTATFTISIDKSNSTAPYEMNIYTAYSDARSASANLLMLQKPGYQSMMVVADSNLTIVPPSGIPNPPPGNNTFYRRKIPVPTTPQCTEKDGKYYYDGKEVTSEDDMVKYSCPVYCKMFPDSTRTEDHYGWADQAHYGTDANGGKHYFNREDYEKFCNTKCQIVDNVHHCGPEYINNTGSSSDVCSADDYNKYCEGGKNVCKHIGDTYYCKNGETCDSNKFFEDCCDTLDPNSDDYQKYCSCGNADIEFIGACTEFNSSNETLLNHVADTPDDAKLKYCLFNPSSKDKANNSYQMTDQTTVVNNPYCKVSCVEEYEFRLPNSQYTLSGSYFTLETEVKGNRKCYVNGQDIYDGIDIKKFKEDFEAKRKELIDAYNVYAKWNAAANKAETSTSLTCSYSGRSCDADDSGCSSCSGGSKQATGYEKSWSWTEYSYTGVASNKSESYGPGSSSDGTCDCTISPESSHQAEHEKNRASALDTLNTKMKELQNIILNYNNCSGAISSSGNSIGFEIPSSTGWENEFQFDPLVQFEYDEPYQNMNGYNNKFEKVETTKDETKNNFCTGEVGDKYECSGSKELTTNTENFVLCTTNGCASVPVTLGNARYIIRSRTEAATYKPKNGFSIYTPSGTIALDRGNYVLYTGLCDGKEECLPIALNTPTGVFNFKFRFSQIGQFNDNNSVGRLVGGDKSVYNAVSNQQQAGYVCHYVNNCPECDYVCVGDDCEIKQPDCEDECTYVCQNCIFDGENSTFYYRTVSINNLFPNSRQYGPNWNNSKGNYTKKVIEEAGETVYQEPQYSYTMNAQQMNRIRGFNKSVGDYLNTKMPNGEDSLTCHDLSSNGKNYQNIYCISSFLDTEGNAYFTENKRNDIWTLWPDSGYFTNNTKYSVALGVGPSWR